MLANCCMRRCQGEGTMATTGQWRPSWLGCVFLPSFRLSNCVSGVPQPQNHPKTSHCPTAYLYQYGWMGTFQVPILCACTVKNTWAIWMKDLFILGVALPGEASETMVKLCVWPSMVLLRKLAIYCNYIWYILCKTDVYVLGLQKRKKA